MFGREEGFLIEEGQVLRERSHSITGFKGEVVKRGYGFFVRISWVHRRFT
jgi:hypothetical protein